MRSLTLSGNSSLNFFILLLVVLASDLTSTGKNEFQGEEIEFVSISIDENRKKWKEYVREHQLGGVQLWAGDWSRLPEELHVGSIPRFILIDKEGNWVDTEALRPSNPALKKLLKNLLKK